jgi:virginiamycin B lyase
LDITAGPDGALWFTTFNDNVIGRISTNDDITRFTDPNSNHPRSITAGPDGALCFTTFYRNAIGRVTTAGVFATFTNPEINNPVDITAGPDGALWCTELGTPGGIPGTAGDNWTHHHDRRHQHLHRSEYRQPGIHHGRPGRSPLVHQRGK